MVLQLIVQFVVEIKAPGLCPESTLMIRYTVRYTLKIMSVLKSDVTYNSSLMVGSGFTTFTTTSTPLNKSYLISSAVLQCGTV